MNENYHIVYDEATLIRIEGSRTKFLHGIATMHSNSFANNIGKAKNSFPVFAVEVRYLKKYRYRARCANRSCFTKKMNELTVTPGQAMYLYMNLTTIEHIKSGAPLLHKFTREPITDEQAFEMCEWHLMAQTIMRNRDETEDMVKKNNPRIFSQKNIIA